VPVPVSVPIPIQESSETVIAQLSGSTIVDLSIALRKERHNCTQHHLSNCIFILIYHSFVHLFLLWTHVQFQKMYQKHSLIQVQAMPEEITALQQNETWELVILPPEKKSRWVSGSLKDKIGCQNIFTSA